MKSENKPATPPKMNAGETPSAGTEREEGELPNVIAAYFRDTPREKILADLAEVERISTPAPTDETTTPRTDAVSFHSATAVNAGATGMVVEADFARTLERELNAAKEESNFAWREEYKKTASKLHALAARLVEVEKAAGFCEKHIPNGGARHCLVCACERLGFALSKISGLCGDAEHPDYDIHCNEDEVVKQVASLRSALAAAEAALVQAKQEAKSADFLFKELYELVGMALGPRFHTANGNIVDEVRSLLAHHDTSVTENISLKNQLGRVDKATVEQFSYLRAANTALSAQVEELKRDGERIDWLEQHPFMFYRDRDGDKLVNHFTIVDEDAGRKHGRRGILGGTARQAIDAARAHAKQTP